MAIKMISVEEIGGFRLGNAEDSEKGTGCTVIICEEGAVGGVDVRGGGPATRETDLLRSENTVNAVNAVVLSGGSAFGLESASGVMRELAGRKVGFDVGDGIVVPIVCGASLYDLPMGDPSAFPDVAMGIEAVRSAYEGVFSHGNHGAGTGATVGKIKGYERAMKTGLGTFACGDEFIKVGAIAAVNAVGDVYNGAGNIIAGLRSEDGKAIFGTIKTLKNMVHDEVAPVEEKPAYISKSDLAEALAEVSRKFREQEAAGSAHVTAAAAPEEGSPAVAAEAVTDIKTAEEVPARAAAEDIPVMEPAAETPAGEPVDDIHDEQAAEEAAHPEEPVPEVAPEAIPEESAIAEAPYAEAEEETPAAEAAEVSIPETPAEPVTESVQAAAHDEVISVSVPDEAPAEEAAEEAAAEVSIPEIPAEETAEEIPADTADEVQPEEPVSYETPAEPLAEDQSPAFAVSEPEAEPEPVFEDRPAWTYEEPQEEEEEEDEGPVVLTREEMGYDITFNTTISCLITNAELTKSQANKLASILHDAYARAIKPVHGTLDGDTVFVLATGQQKVNFDAFAALATDVMQYAIIDGALSAEGAYGLPAARDM